MSRLKRCLPLLFFALLHLPAFGKSLQVASGVDIVASVYPGESDSILLWIPPEWGLQGREPETARQIAAAGIETWIVDLHSAYFEPVGRTSLENVPIDDVADLIEQVRTESGKRVYLFSAGRGAALSLLAARQWQITHKEKSGLGGAVFLYPNLTEGAPQPGEEVSFTPVTAVTNLPVFIFQPTLSARYWQLPALTQTLEKGGSAVYTQALKDVSDGFNLRPTRSDTEEQSASRLPLLVKRAVSMLGRHTETRLAPRTAQPTDRLNAGELAIGLQPYKGQLGIPALKLASLDGETWDIQNQRGNVLLVNFWTTWCPPCVKELPSLNRLQKQLAGKPFRIVGVNVAESREAVEKFLSEVKVEFPLVMDPAGSTVKQWQLLAFPMSFVLDKSGRVRYGLYGAIEWDDEHVLDTIAPLLAE